MGFGFGAFCCGEVALVADCEDGVVGVSEDFFGGRSEEDVAEFGSAFGTDDDEADVIFLGAGDDCFGVVDA